MASKETMYSVRFGPLGYGSDDDGKAIMHDRGQIINLIGGPNDEQLIRLGYIIEYIGETFECGECGKRFVDQRLRSAHGDRQHNAELTEDERAERLERDLALAAKQAPLYMDKTTAAQTA